jgi:hypothetical protein
MKGYEAILSLDVFGFELKLRKRGCTEAKALDEFRKHTDTKYQSRINAISGFDTHLFGKRTKEKICLDPCLERNEHS